MTRLRPLSNPDHLPALDTRFALRRPSLGLGPNDHPLRFLLLYGSLRERSYSRLATEEAARRSTPPRRCLHENRGLRSDRSG